MKDYVLNQGTNMRVYSAYLLVADAAHDNRLNSHPMWKQRHSGTFSM